MKINFYSESKVRTNMSIQSKKDFNFLIGDADPAIKEDFYSRLVMIEEGLKESKLAATSTKNVFEYEAIAEFLRGIELIAPHQEFYDDFGRNIGSISLPTDLGDFLSTYCKGSTDAAFQLLKMLKVKSRRSPGEHMQKSLNNLSPIVYFIDLIDRRYKFYIGNNPKYSGRKPKNSDLNQLYYSEIHPAFGTKKDVQNLFLAYFKDLFDNEPTPKQTYALGPWLDGYCQYCHRPNLKNKKFCSTHALDRNGNNSKANSISTAFQKAFRNLGLLLYDEVGLIQDHPKDYIKLAKKRREEEASKHGRLRVIQNEFKSEYFLKLEGWVKHNATYRNFLEIILKDYRQHDKNLKMATEWTDQSNLKLISKVLNHFEKSHYTSKKHIPDNIKNIPKNDLKNALLGQSGLNIDPKIQKNVTIDDWITMICRAFQYELISSCQNKKIADQLNASHSKN